jgi:hypothetical protein
MCGPDPNGVEQRTVGVTFAPLPGRTEINY